MDLQTTKSYALYVLYMSFLDFRNATIPMYIGIFDTFLDIKMLCIPIIATLIAKAITLSPIVGVTVIKCHEFSSGYKSSEQASTMPSLLQSRFLENWEKEKKKKSQWIVRIYADTHT